MGRTKYCFVEGCFSASSSGMQFFCFPNNPERRNTWIEFAGRNVEPTKNSRICSLHFSPNSYFNSVTLLPTAIPTLRCQHPLCPAVVSPASPISYNPSLSPKPAAVPSSSTPTPGQHSPPLFSSPMLSLPVSRPLVFSPLPATQGGASGVASSLVSLEALEMQLFPPDLPAEDSFNLAAIGATRHTKLTPRKKTLLKRGQLLAKSYKRMKRRFVENKKKVVDNMRAGKFGSNLQRLEDTSAGFIVRALLDNADRNKRGRRWSFKDKVAFLALYKRGPRAYRFLSSLITLPSPRTLTNLIQSSFFHSGINDAIFKTLAYSMESMEDCDRLCFLTFDEMSIKENLHYNPSCDIIEGFEDHGHLGRTNNHAKFALMFMLRGLGKSWKQPIAFYFSTSGMASGILRELIVKVLQSCWNANCNVVATVCDMGSNNTAALKQLGVSESQPFFSVGDRKVVALYDPPHLIKATRNALHKYDVQCTVQNLKVCSTDGKAPVLRGVAKWEDIKLAYELDKRNLFRMMYKLTDSHIQPDEKMKVKLATQVLSHSVAAGITAICQMNELPSSALATASFVGFANKLFSSLNGTGTTPNDMRKNEDVTHSLTPSSGHCTFWADAVTEIQSWRFQLKGEPEDMKHKRRVRRVMPFQKGWVTTINGMRMLWGIVRSSLNKLSPRHINQDALENAFGTIRSHCGCNDHPTVGQFVSALKTSIINGLQHSDILKGTNCKSDGAVLLSRLTSAFCGRGQGQNNVPDIDHTASNESFAECDRAEVNDEEDVIDFDLRTISGNYVAGFVVKRVLSGISCDACKRVLISTENSLLHSGILLKEFTPDQQALTYPSEDIVKAVLEGANIVDEMLDENASLKGVVQCIIQTIRRKVGFLWLQESERLYECAIDVVEDHNMHVDSVKEKIALAIAKICVPWWCTRRNRKLKEQRKARKMRKMNLGA